MTPPEARFSMKTIKSLAASVAPGPAAQAAALRCARARASRLLAGLTVKGLPASQMRGAAAISFAARERAAAQDSMDAAALQMGAWGALISATVNPDSFRDMPAATGPARVSMFSVVPDARPFSSAR